MGILKKTTLFITIIGLLALPSFRWFDDGLAERIRQQLASYLATYQPEKAYLHTDRSTYLPGEEVWFKAYLVDASTHRPDSLSNVLYVELTRPDGRVLLREKVKMTSGLGHGDLALPTTLSGGSYQLRAYTNWMRNSDPAFFFSKMIQVVKEIPVGSNLPAGAKNTDIDLQFFPEGGELVEGLPSIVAFKAVDGSGKGITVKGAIVDQQDTLATAFQDAHLGMGTFEFKPAVGIRYSAKVVTEDGRTRTFAFPRSLYAGFVIRAEAVGDEKIKVTVRSNENLPTSANQMVLIAQVRGKVCFSTNATLSRQPSGIGEISLEIPKAQLPSGIVQLTLFDGQGMPRCERLCFVNHHDDLRIQVAADKPAYAPREKVTLDVTVRDQNNNPLAGNFSLAVTSQSEAGQWAETMLTNLLLSSDLKGTIEQPGFYFQANRPEAAKALDNLLLTQGWRRFTWKELMNVAGSRPTYKRETGISLSGSLTKPAGEPIPSGILTAAVVGQPNSFRYETTNEQGKFTFNGLELYGTHAILLQPNPRMAQNRAAKLQLDTIGTVGTLPFKESVRWQPNGVTQNVARKALLQRRIKVNYQSESGNDETEAVNDQSTDSSQSLIRPYQKPDERVRLEEYISFPSMTDVFREVVPSVILAKREGATIARLLDPQTKMYFKGEPLYLVDNIPVYDFNILLNLDPATVESIDVLKSPANRALFGQLSFNGVVAIYTQSSDFYPSAQSGLYTVQWQGYQQPREFYSPVYNQPEPPRNQPDFRFTQYWKPAFTTDASGKATVSFFQSDDLGTLNVVVEGISPQGLPGTANFQYEVKPAKKK